MTGDLKEALRDPAYLDLHLQAVAAIKRVERGDWYDSRFLHSFEAAKRYLGYVRPDALSRFIEGIAPLRPDADFTPIAVSDLFDAATHDRIREVAATIPEQTLELHELEAFGRHVVHDHPYFVELQREVLPLVEHRIGRNLVVSYNFLSLYGGSGSCALHMDEPGSMYTLDYCIEQSTDWPIHISQPVEWPTPDDPEYLDPEWIKDDPRFEFSEYRLSPNDALIFNGSSQWHYRDPISSGENCSLLFFHYYPAGCEKIVYPRRWHEYFDIPELGPFCDLLSD